jgi:hypothetical protein
LFFLCSLPFWDRDQDLQLKPTNTAVDVYLQGQYPRHVRDSMTWSFEIETVFSLEPPTVNEILTLLKRFGPMARAGHRPHLTDCGIAIQTRPISLAVAPLRG